MSGPSATRHTQPWGKQLPVPPLTLRGAHGYKTAQELFPGRVIPPERPRQGWELQQNMPGRRTWLGLVCWGGGWRGQAVTAGAVHWGQQGWRLQHLPSPWDFPLQPLPPVSGVPCHGQARAGVPQSRGTDQGGGKVKRGQAAEAGWVRLCACRGQMQSRGGCECPAEQLPPLALWWQKLGALQLLLCSHRAGPARPWRI